MQNGQASETMTARPFRERDRERFRKIVSVMEGATITGEREAARQAAERMAAMHGMSIDEAILDTHPERDDGRIDENERDLRRQAYEAWTADRRRWSDEKERAEKRKHEEARAEAQRRGMADDPAPRRRAYPRYTPQFRPSHYRPTEDDRFRLIAGLLRDGVPLRRVANLADTSTHEVARVWLLIRSSTGPKPA